MAKRLVLLFLMAALLAPAAVAQRERNYIYVFDCTSSMLGVLPGGLTPLLFEQDNLYTRTKNWLREDIEKIPAGSTATVTIIPFHQSTGKTITFVRRDFNWKEISEVLDACVRQSHSTGICQAWDKGLEYIDPEKDNYFFLLTDGAENVVPNGCEAVKKRIRDWCRRSAANAYAFYVALSPEAYDGCQGLKEAASECDRVSFIDSHIGPFGSFAANEINISSRALKDKWVSFSAEGTYTVGVTCRDPYFDVVVKDGAIVDGHVTFRFNKKQEMADTSYVFSFAVESDVRKLQITNPVFTVHVDNRGARSLDIVADEVDGGRATSYPRFLFWKAKRPDTVTVDLGTSWNDEARREHSLMYMAVECDKLEGKDYAVVWNGTTVSDGRFTIAPDDEAARLAIVLSPDVETGKYIFRLKGSGANLETVNDERTALYNNTVRVKNQVLWNPLLTMLVALLAVLVAAAVLWFVFFRRMLYPTFKVGRYQIASPYFSQRSIKRVRMVVFTDSNKRQSRLGKLFTGRVVYERNPFWTTEWTMTPSAKKGCRVGNLSPAYSIDPYGTTLTPQNTYTIENNATHESASISIY